MLNTRAKFPLFCDLQAAELFLTSARFAQFPTTT